MLTYISLGQKYFVKRFGFVLRSDKWQNRDVDAKLAVKKDVPAGKSGTKNKLIVNAVYRFLVMSWYYKSPLADGIKKAKTTIIPLVMEG